MKNAKPAAERAVTDPAEIREIVSRIPNPDIVYGLEVPHQDRLEEMGFEAYARHVLETAKACMGEAGSIK